MLPAESTSFFPVGFGKAQQSSGEKKKSKNQTKQNQTPKQNKIKPLEYLTKMKKK